MDRYAEQDRLTSPESVAREPPLFDKSRVNKQPHQPTSQYVTSSGSPLYTSLLFTPSTASNSPKHFPSPRSREVFRQLTREILDLTEPQPAMMDADDDDDGYSTLDPKKYDPGNSMEIPIIYNKYKKYVQKL